MSFYVLCLHENCLSSINVINIMKYTVSIQHIHHTTPSYFNDKTKDNFKFVMLNNWYELLIIQNKLFSNQLSYSDVYSMDNKHKLKKKIH